MPLHTPPRIMIVESYRGNIISLSNHLSTYGEPMEIVTAPDGASAMAQLESQPANLIIVDVVLRGNMDGFEFCRALRKSGPDSKLPIILLLTGHLLLERYKGISAGADLLLLRPIVKEELFKMVQLLLLRRFEESESTRLAPPQGEAVRRLHVVA